jgi:arylsulfatase A-like enzyme
LFVGLATIASHQPFTGLPPSLRAFYPEPKDRREAYLNNLKMVDDSLKVLVEELKKSPFGKNAVLIVTGDHGFPLGEHGSFHNENFAFNENFGVPLLIMDFRKTNGGLKTGTLKAETPHGAFSHVNLAATILDLAGFSGPTDFVGKSIFSKDLAAKGDTVYLVQPYSGGYVADIQWPYKYIFERARLGEVVYNLEKDPGEHKDLLPSLNPTELSTLRQGAAQIMRQQEVLSCEGK